ncbi:type 1 glutamine amidotransferase domain-containing protein [Sphingomicrobium aestuariivivum]|uniref:type 1 glutamine amidotransferase domain-containing protein n=1 Tax=Sphingomicrobium aestuariivivum TaxID=1582356 RepID=UPI001FD6AEEC|nr:type 1 glutamine amidotransferase domain-containing protein [Sphingomicrobium aestuariivivum]MCJ8191619.1 type 1 glutamine amidotransferase domain-containing protein [Sphingomicrobium aestuariivivum]
MLRILLACFITLMAWPTPLAAQDSREALLVVSSHGRDGGEAQPGFEMDELAQAWLVLASNGYDVRIASPEGGLVVADKYDASKAYNAAFLGDPLAASRLASTLRLDPAMGTGYDIVMVIGGKGAMFDLPFSQILQSILLEQHDRGAVVVAVCHGPAVLARVEREDGTRLVTGRRLSAFTDEEEAAFGEKWVGDFPFLIETRLRELGATFEESDIMLPHVSVDANLVTGQNPFSVVGATEAAIRADGHRPAPRAMWKDERSMMLVAQAAAGDKAPLARAIANEPASLDIPIVAAWAYYRGLMVKDDPQALSLSIELLELARPHMDEPQLGQVIHMLREERAALCATSACPAS